MALLPAVPLNSLRHMAGFYEQVRVDIALVRLRGFGHRGQLLVGVIIPFERPCALTLLEDPQPRDILQQTNCAAEADLIRKIQFEGPRVDDRLGNLDAHQRPCSRADVAPVVTFSGYRGYGGCGVMPGGCEDRRTCETRAIRNVRQQIAELCPGLNQRWKN